jgi:zinc metalloprotease ZmpA
VKRKVPLTIGLVVGTAAASAMVAVAMPAGAQEVSLPTAAPSPANGAAALVASRPAVLKASSDDAFVAHPPITSHGSHFHPYDRTYKGLHVTGGDFVVVTDDAGNVQYTSVAQDKPVSLASTTPKLSSAAALRIAKTKLKTVSNVEGTDLVVYAVDGHSPTLSWESTIQGTSTEGASRQTVDVDATTGAILGTQEHVTEATGSGTGWINGRVSLNTTQSGSTYSMTDPAIRNLSCQDAATNRPFTKAGNVWGTGSGTDRETGCVDALYIAQMQVRMLSSWTGRNGPDGNGGAWPMRVGLNDQNAYYDGTQVQIGRNTAGQWITSADVIGHELGHGIDDKTPGSMSGQGTQEFVADTYGAATEWYANNPNDPPDFTVGEEINLVGRGPIRNMYNPSAVGDSNCYSSSTPSQEVHAAAGPGDHWFYLVSQGTSGNGQPASTTCNGSTVNGLGIQTAIKVMYNAMLMKTSGASYPRYRAWTLAAAKNLTPGNCMVFNTVKAAWNAVSVPAQSGESTCTGTTPPTTGPTGPTTGPTGPTTGPTSGPSTPPSTGTWVVNHAYKAGDTVTYNGVSYRCLQGHTSTTGWEPPNVPALWQRV